MGGDLGRRGGRPDGRGESARCCVRLCRHEETSSGHRVGQGAVVVVVVAVRPVQQANVSMYVCM